MDPNDFQHSTSGRCVLTRQGFWAFIPNTLPPAIELDWNLVQLISEADRALSELSGVGMLLPNPHLLIGPCVRREAVVSSRIEDTQAGMDDLFFFEAEPTESPRIQDVREVANYVQAMDHGLKRLRELPLSGRLIREIHECLMSDVRGGHATPGEFRRSPNWIGTPGCTLSDATFVPPPPEEMMEALHDWERYLHSNAKEPPLVQCAIMHYQFEAIHPFLDGNGRIGRLLITFFLCERGCLSQPLLYLSDYFERNRIEYYHRLLAVSRNGDWRGWLEFFLQGIAEQAREGLMSTRTLLELHSDYRAKATATKCPSATLKLVDELFNNPVVSISGLSKHWGITYTTVQKAIEYLVSRDLLKEVTGRRRNRLFMAPELFEVLVGRWRGTERANRGMR